MNSGRSSCTPFPLSNLSQHSIQKVSTKHAPPAPIIREERLIGVRKSANADHQFLMCLASRRSISRICFFNLSQAMPHGSATATHKHCAPAHMVLLFVSFCTMTVQVDAEVAKGLEEMARRGGKWTRSDGIPYFGKEREPQVHSARSEHPPKGCSFVTLFVSKRALMVPSCAIFSFTHTHTHTQTHSHRHIHTFTRQPLSRFVMSGRDSEHPVMSGPLGALRSRPSQQSTVAFRT